MSANISNLTDAILYVDGATFVGEVSGFTPPEMTQGQVSNDGIGYSYTPSFPSGRFEELEATISLNAPTAEATALGADQLSGRNLLLMGNLQTAQSGGAISEVPIVYKMTGRVKTYNLGDLQAKDKAAPEITVTLDSISIEIDGALVLNFDGKAQTYEVNGVNLFATRNSNLGIQ